MWLYHYFLPLSLSSLFIIIIMIIHHHYNYIIYFIYFFYIISLFANLKQQNRKMPLMGLTSQFHHIKTAPSSRSPQFSNAAQNGEVPLVRLTSHCAWISSTFNCVNTKLDKQVDQKKDNFGQTRPFKGGQGQLFDCYVPILNICAIDWVDSIVGEIF